MRSKQVTSREELLAHGDEARGVDLVEEPQGGKARQGVTSTVSSCIDVKKSYRFEQGFTLELYTSPDSQEARNAFVEKRDASFKDKN